MNGPMDQMNGPMNGPMDQMNGPMYGPMDQMGEWTRNLLWGVSGRLDGLTSTGSKLLAQSSSESSSSSPSSYITRYKGLFRSYSRSFARLEARLWCVDAVSYGRSDTFGR